MYRIRLHGIQWISYIRILGPLMFLLISIKSLTPQLDHFLLMIVLCIEQPTREKRPVETLTYTGLQNNYMYYYIPLYKDVVIIGGLKSLIILKAAYKWLSVDFWYNTTVWLWCIDIVIVNIHNNCILLNLPNQFWCQSTYSIRTHSYFAAIHHFRLSFTHLRSKGIF